MNHLNVDKDYVQSLVESAAWAAVEIKPTKIEKKLEEASDDSADDSTEDSEPQAHTCPLCESTLEEDLSDDRILEHLESMMAVVNQVSEDLEVLSEEEDEDEDSEEASDDEDSSDLEGVLAKLDSDDLEVLASYLDTEE
tara:strand:- start:488 stop:904 length:417 start_codon:yes stop_codon:yes gene_type:complete